MKIIHVIAVAIFVALGVSLAIDGIPSFAGENAPAVTTAANWSAQ